MPEEGRGERTKGMGDMRQGYVGGGVFTPHFVLLLQASRELILRVHLFKLCDSRSVVVVCLSLQVVKPNLGAEDAQKTCI